MPRSSPVSFDRIAPVYDETRSLRPDQMEAVATALHTALAPHDRVLEVGIGTGRIALPLQERGVRVLGVDVSREMTARAEGKGVRDILHADARHLPFRDRSFGAAYSVHVLHLLEDWRGALHEVARITREAYYTVATYWTAPEGQRAPLRLYWAAVREAGYDRIRPGVFERDLPDHLPPAARVPIGTFVEERNVAEAIDWLEQRIYSGQWHLPESVHREALEAVRAQIPAPTQTFSKRVELLRWEIADLTTL